MKADYTKFDKLTAKLPKECSKGECKLDTLVDFRLAKRLDAADPLNLVPGAFYDVDQRAGEKGNKTERYQFVKHTFQYGHGMVRLTYAVVHTFKHIWWFTASTGTKNRYVTDAGRIKRLSKSQKAPAK